MIAELLQEENKIDLLRDTDLVRRLKDYGNVLGKSLFVFPFITVALTSISGI